MIRRIAPATFLKLLLVLPEAAIKLFEDRWHADLAKKLTTFVSIEWNRVVPEQDVLCSSYKTGRGMGLDLEKTVQRQPVHRTGAIREELVQPSIEHLADEATKGEIGALV
jgi:hypothetical protein